MSDNANQPNSRVGSENSGNGGHFDQGGGRYNQSGNRNNRRRRPSQQIGGEQSDNHSKRPASNYPGNPAQQNAQPGGVQSSSPMAQTGKHQNNYGRQDSFGSRRNSNNGNGNNNNNNNNDRANRQNQDVNTNAAQAAARTPSSVVSHGTVRTADKSEQIPDKQGSAGRFDKTDNQSFVNRKNTVPQTAKTERPREPRTWGRNIRAEETHEDVRRENERIEKEIWLEIASIHTFKLD